MEQPRKNSVLRISDDKTLELIGLYEKEECLWNTELSTYKNRAKRREAAERIAKKLAIDNFDARHVAIKFKNLRNSYCQELKKMAYGDPVEERPKVWWFTKMDSFLRPHLQSTAPWDLNTLKQEETHKIYLEESVDELVQMTDTEDVIVDSEVEEKPDLLIERRKRLRPQTKSKHLIQANRTKILDKEKVKRSDITHSVNTHDDCFDNFGKYVASMLKAMPKRKAMELQPKIVKLLTSNNYENTEDSESDAWE